MDEIKAEETSRWIGAAACSALVLLVSIGSLFAMRDQLVEQSRADARAQDQARVKIITRMDAMQSVVEALAAQQQPDITALDSLRNALDALTMRVEVLEKTAAEKKPEPSPQSSSSPPPYTAPQSDIDALRLAALSGQPFTEELAAWEKNNPDMVKNVTALRDVAATGITSEAELSRRLLDTLEKKPQAAPVDDSNMIGKINTHLKGLVSIKKTAADHYAELRIEAQRGNTASLMQRIEQLRESERAPLADWLERAKARRTALDTLTQLSPPAER